MTNQEYYKEIETRIIGLDSLRKDVIKLSVGVIGETLISDDFFFCASADRCLNLIDGFISMLQCRNLTCAGALVRLQMDNCMRTYAAFIAEDRNAVVDCIIKGESLKSKKTMDGKKMLDCNLKQILTDLDPVFGQVYDQASGYIHLSEKAFYQTIAECENGKIKLQIGRELPELRNPVLIEAADAFIHFTRLYLKMLTAVADSKKRFDASCSVEN